ncbi:hypothetical protein PHLGIDRAFT_36080 [Phlebiopsis gigantea 11061_1 CR5-6]|uniref:Uncharacterized protein n=1 Tax=Phlebiopsis gigantea (strain 11061_1 CR5-6) TaxID=745531 RepID=A0A0C3RWV0_PHLG1|nr:hypothetical protein PHLGIDRAFT_36080 [Phlebiopsis gigantea 11061_1 CR5-6]
MLALVRPVSRHVLVLWRTHVLGAPPVAGNNPNAAAQAWARECECRACGIMQRWVLRPNARAVVDVGIVGLRHKVHFLGLLKKHGRRLVDGWTHIYGAEHCYFFTIRKSQELSVLHQFLNEKQFARESLQGLDLSEICDSETLSLLVDA